MFSTTSLPLNSHATFHGNKRNFFKNSRHKFPPRRKWQERKAPATQEIWCSSIKYETFWFHWHHHLCFEREREREDSKDDTEKGRATFDTTNLRAFEASRVENYLAIYSWRGKSFHDLRLRFLCVKLVDLLSLGFSILLWIIRGKRKLYDCFSWKVLKLLKRFLTRDLKPVNR